MGDVTRSNMDLSIPSSSRSILREQALAPWRFKPSDTANDQDADADAAWIYQASRRDMEMVIRALERELNSRPDECVLMDTLNNNIVGSSRSEVASSSTSSCDPGSPSQAAVGAKASASVEVLDSMAAESETPEARSRLSRALSRSCNNRRSVAVRNNFIGKRRSRRGNRTTITIMRENPTASQAMVEQMTCFPVENSSGPPHSMLKPEPSRREAAPIPPKNNQNPSYGKGFRPL